MYSIHPWTCTAYTHGHVQYTPMDMYSIHPWTCTVYTHGHVQYTPMDMYSIHPWTCTVYTHGHVQYTPMDMYSIHPWACMHPWTCIQVTHWHVCIQWSEAVACTRMHKGVFPVFFNTLSVVCVSDNNMYCVQNTPGFDEKLFLVAMWLE